MDEYLTKTSFERSFLDGIRSDSFREEVTRIIRDYEFQLQKVNLNSDGAGGKNVREKRNVKHTVDYNYLSVQAEDPEMRVRDPLEGIEGGTRKDVDKGDANGDWIWITSSSRIPVSANI